jgi:2-amino-4-hydroxy-6-hydroxymethyldihydropteridine diphosphokinase
MKKADDMEPVTAYLALGANLGDRQRQLQGARTALAATDGIRVTAASPLYASPLYETEPVRGPPDQPPYLNAVLRVETTLSCRSLLERCLSVEARFGRRRQEPWGPRTLDVDLLFYGGEILDEPGLTVPHPRLHQRRFVLVPLADLAPELLHPVLGWSVLQLLTALGNGEPVRLYAREW